MKSKKFPLIDDNSSTTELIPYFEFCLNAQVYRSDVVSQTEISKTNFFSIFRYSGNEVILSAHNINDSLIFENILKENEYLIFKELIKIYYKFIKMIDLNIQEELISIRFHSFEPTIFFNTEKEFYDFLEFNIIGNKNFQLIKNSNGVYCLFFCTLGKEYNLKLDNLKNSINSIQKFFVNYIQQYIPDFDITDYNSDDIKSVFSMINI